jgi:5-methylcytosine-specific restriction endonuclease McrA
MCGLSAGEPDPNRGGAKTKLQVSHVTDMSHGGGNTLNNLKTFCMTCNQGAQNLVQEPPSKIWLLSQIRRAKNDDQQAVLEWLKKRFLEN